MLKRVLINFLFSVVVLFSASLTLAHVTVKPNEVGAAKFQTFTVGVPVEKEIPTVGLRLVIPEGLNHVSPNVKPGWTIELKKTGGDKEIKVTEIVWTGGNIPLEFRDEFTFSAQVPSKETILVWKAYQIYEDGSVIAWDLDPKRSEDQEDFSKSGPYSETKIIDDLKTQQAATEERNSVKIISTLVAISLLLSLTSLTLNLKNRKK